MPPVCHGGHDDVRTMDPVLVAKLFGLVEPFSSQELQLTLIAHSFLERSDNKWSKSKKGLFLQNIFLKSHFTKL